MKKIRKHLHIYSDARSVLFVTHIVEFILLLGMSLLVFTLPRSVENLSALADDWDIFYRFVFQFTLGFAEENYITVGTYIAVFAFLQLISALIVHGRYRKLLFVNVLTSIPLVIFYPLGAFFAGWNLVLIYVFNDQRKRK